MKIAQDSNDIVDTVRNPPLVCKFTDLHLTTSIAEYNLFGQ